MSEEKLYAVKNDDGAWLSLDGMKTEIWYSNNPTLFKDKSYAEAQSMGRKAHVVTLIEASKPEVVSEKEAKMLATLMDGDLMPVSELSYFVRHAEQLPEKESIEREDRLMRAYVNGYTVENEKKYNVKVPHTKDVWYYKDSETYLQTICSSDKELHGKFTEADIEHYGLQDCERVDVRADSARTTGEAKSHD